MDQHTPRPPRCTARPSPFTVACWVDHAMGRGGRGEARSDVRMSGRCGVLLAHLMQSFLLCAISLRTAETPPRRPLSAPGLTLTVTRLHTRHDVRRTSQPPPSHVRVTPRPLAGVRSGRLSRGNDTRNMCGAGNQTCTVCHSCVRGRARRLHVRAQQRRAAGTRGSRGRRERTCARR